MMCMLAKPYSGQNVFGWLVSEKLDGVRAIWTGSELLTRNGTVIRAPDWFLQSLPTVKLDGELWCGRRMFQTTVSIVRRQVPDSRWREVQYKVFDAPSQKPFSLRLLDVPEALRLEHTYEDPWAVYNRVVPLGAEGVMIRDPNAPYIYARSDRLLKLKPTDCSEATVRTYISGRGKHIGRVGALVCDWQGKTIYLGTGMTDQEREVPPLPGKIVTFSYQGLTVDGYPRFPAFVCVRDYE